MLEKFQDFRDLLLSKGHQFFVEATLLIVASYFITRKTFDISASGWLESIFQETYVDWFVSLATVLVAYALIARIGIFVIKHFEDELTPNIGVPHYRCLLNNNKEIEEHIREMKKGLIDNIIDQHSYVKNIQIVHSNFTEHIRNVLGEKKVGLQDIFISLFHVEDVNLESKHIKKYTYVAHHEPTVHDTETEEIDISSEVYSQFAGVKAIKRKKVVVGDCKNGNEYHIGTEERRKTICQYIGIPLKIDGKVLGLLNVEFHNKAPFKNVNSLKEFYKNEVQAFTYLYEYQIHKRLFFEQIRNRNVEQAA